MAAIRKITTAIITQDEAERIGDAIRSCLGFSDEVLVIDGGSRDDTPAIAEGLGCVVVHNPWPGYSAQRNFAAERASCDWIFFIDSDEVAGEDLGTALAEWKSSPEKSGEPGGYLVHRVGDFLGRWMGSQDLVRLYDRRRHRINDVVLDEEVDISPGQTGRLGGTLWHYGFRSIGEHLERFSGYTETWADEAVARGVRFSFFRLLLRPPARFFQRYILMGLFRKGVPGFAASAFWGYFEFLKELRIFEKSWRMKGPGAGAHEKRR